MDVNADRLAVSVDLVALDCCIKQFIYRVIGVLAVPQTKDPSMGCGLAYVLLIVDTIH